MARACISLAEAKIKRLKQFDIAQSEAKKCGQRTVIYWDSKKAKFVGKPFRCKKDICPICGPQLKQRTVQEVTFFANHFGMINFGTFTCDSKTFELLERTFKICKEQMGLMESPALYKRWMHCKNAEAGYNEFVQKCIEREKFAVWMFNCYFYPADKESTRYLNRVHYALQVQKHLYAGTLKSYMANYELEDVTEFEDTYIKNGYGLYEKYNDMKDAGVANDFYQDIAKKLLYVIFEYQYNKLNKLREYIDSVALERIYFTIGKHFSYVRTWEFQHDDKMKRPHYHFLTNTYIPFLIIEKLESEKCYVFDQGLFSKQDIDNPMYEPVIDATDSVHYMTKYITKDTAQHIFEMETLNDNGIVSVPHDITYSADIASYKSRFKLLTENSGLEMKCTVDGVLPEGNIMDLCMDFNESIRDIKRVLLPSYLGNQNVYYLKAIEIEKARKAELNAKKHDNAHKSLIHVKYDDQITKLGIAFLENEFERRIGQWQYAAHDLINYEGLDVGQVAALETLYSTNQPELITGGAGTGKTTLVSTAVKYSNCKLAVVSFTGKATERVRSKIYEVTSSTKDVTVSTIHKLCGAVYSHLPNFTSHEGRLLNYDMVIVDEIGMVDCLTLAMLLNALPVTTRLVFVGDRNQLPPVQYGSSVPTLHKYCNNKQLTVNHRSGQFVNDLAYTFFKPYENNIFADYESNYDSIIDMAKQGYKVLTTSKRLERAINRAMTEEYPILNGTSESEKNCYHYMVGQEVMFLVNTKNFQNGSTGTITAYNDDTGIFTFDKDFELDIFASATMFKPAFALTVHKSQGSEYDKVVFIVDDYEQLSNTNIAYTAVSRAQKDIKLYKTKKADVKKLYNNLIY